MKHSKKILTLISLFLFLFLSACKNKQQNTIPELANLNLLRGDILLCGSGNFGDVSFAFSCNYETRDDFNIAISLLHSFEHDEAEKVFAKVIDADPNCAMGYWGVAMSKFHTVWRRPTVHQLKTGAVAIDIARSIQNKSEKETDYIEAAANLYTDWDKLDHLVRTSRFASAMEKIYYKYPNDKEVAVFYSYALLAAADLSDKTYVNQKKAGLILGQLFPEKSNHPGIAHYTIHSYDYPGLAHLALDAARKYASIAPSSAHAQHMPSHIFTRLGLWEESIQSNLRATEAAKCYAEQIEMEGHWDEEVHGIDYLGYAYLQVGKVNNAKELLDYIRSIDKINRIGLKSSYPSASIPARFYLETRQWSKAASLEMYLNDFPTKKFPWANGIIHFTRVLGAVHSGDLKNAKIDMEKLNNCYQILLNKNDPYMANQVNIMVNAANAWIHFYENKKEQALTLMTESANLEYKTEKQPLTPCEVLPAQELLGDLLLKLGKFPEALEAYELNLKIRPNRFNGLYGAAVAAEKSGNKEKAKDYYNQLIELAKDSNSNRPELLEAKAFIEKNQSS